MKDLMDIELFRRKVYDSGRHLVFDECDFISKEPEPSHEFYLNIEKVWTLGGVKWIVRIPNFTATSNHLYEAILSAMLQINRDGPEISRLKDWVASIKKK